MNDKSLRAKIGQAARDHILQTQTLDALVQKEIAVYNSMLKKAKHEKTSTI